MCTVVRERPGLRDTTHTTVCVVTRYKAILFTERAVPVRERRPSHESVMQPAREARVL